MKSQKQSDKPRNDPVKLIFCVALDQHQALVVYLNPLDQLQSFECYHILFDHFLLIDQKSFVHQF